MRTDGMDHPKRENRRLVMQAMRTSGQTCMSRLLFPSLVVMSKVRSSISIFISN